MSTLPSELLDLRDVIRDFMKREVEPLESKLDHDAYKLPENMLDKLQQKARDSGLWQMGSPEEYGGAGMGLLARCIVAEEAAQCRMGAYVPACGAFGWDPPGVIFSGTDEQIQKYAVPAIEAGNRKTFVAISEPGGGSDPARSISTRAVRDGDHYVLNGTKTWITGADEAQWGLVFARTSSEGGEGISCFIVDTDRPGFSTSPIGVIRSWSPCEVVLNDYRVPAANRLGEEGQGFSVAQNWLVNARLPYAAGVIGVAVAALRIATQYVASRETFGKPLAARQSVQWMLADSEIEIRAARLLVHDAAGMAEEGLPFKTEASIAKLYATETAGRVVDRCVQMLGAMGVAKELPLERWYREMRIKRIGEGPSEVHRMVVARDVLSHARARG